MPPVLPSVLLPYDAVSLPGQVALVMMSMMDAYHALLPIHNSTFNHTIIAERMTVTKVAFGDDRDTSICIGWEYNRFLLACSPSRPSMVVLFAH
jgi:hypothetical protein